MLPKRIVVKIMGICVLFIVVVSMAGQVSPVLAGFTPTPVTPTATPVTPTATPVTPTATPVTPTATPVTPTATSVPPTATGFTPTATTVSATATVAATATATVVSVTATPVSTTATPVSVTVTPVITQPVSENTPEMPVTGGQVSGWGNYSTSSIVLIVGMMVLLIAVISLAVRQVASTKTKI